MLCHRCETFLTNLLASDFSTWKRIKDVEEKWFTFKLNNHAGVLASAAAGCEVCALFNRVRNECIPNYENLGEKWHTQPASIDIKHLPDSQRDTSKWSFQLLTVAPEMSCIAFEIFQPESEEDADIGASDWPQEVSESPTSSKSISIAKQWIQDCLNSHQMCTRPDFPPLPTRVIDVGLLDETSSPRLHISRGETSHYVTLSHCWGTGHRTTLTKNNLHKFEKAILLDRLPQTFQDAIHLTRLLGVQYLWLDALCIVQDDQNDWKRESVSMCSVFENAIFSVCAVAATDSHSGMLHNRDPDQIKTTINGTQIGVRQKLDSWQEAMKRSRVETRAWCYQEGLLPISTLFVAPSQMYWHCRTCMVAETKPNDRSLSVLAMRTEEAWESNEKHRPRFGSGWLRLVNVYSARQVTRASDRLPAIAGLAAKAQDELPGSVYLQGLWSHDLHAGVLWKRKLIAHGKLIPSRDRYMARSSTGSAERPRKPIARSWSWASTNGAVEFSTTNLYTERSPTKFDAKFLVPDHGEEDEGIDLPGMIIPLEALVKRGTCRFPSQPSTNPDEASFKPSGSLLVDDGLTCFLDYVDDPTSKTCYCVRISNWRQPSLKPQKKRDVDSEQAFYLLVERVDQKQLDKAADETSFGTFRRIGVGFDITRKVDKIFANAERRILRLV